MFRKTIHALVLGSVLALSGCASGGGGSEDEPLTAQNIGERIETRIAIEVRNNLIPRTSVILKIRAPGRPLKTLGPILSDATETFIVETREIAAGYVLIAERPGQSPMISRRITAVSRAKVSWDLGADRVRIDRL